MALVPVSKETFGQKRLRLDARHLHASAHVIVPLALEEVIPAALNGPVCFTRFQGKFAPALVTHLNNNNNPLVSIEGEWQCPFLPLFFKCYPFVIGVLSDGSKILCCDAASEILSETEGEPLFDSNGGPSDLLQRNMLDLERLSNGRQRAETLCSLVWECGLLTNLSVEFADLETKVAEPLEEMFRFDETRLSVLDTEGFKALHESNAFPFLYAQQLSLRHLSTLISDQKPQKVISNRDTRIDSSGREATLTIAVDEQPITFKDL